MSSIPKIQLKEIALTPMLLHGSALVQAISGLILSLGAPNGLMHSPCKSMQFKCGIFGTGGGLLGVCSEDS